MGHHPTPEVGERTDRADTGFHGPDHDHLAIQQDRAAEQERIVRHTPSLQVRPRLLLDASSSRVCEAPNDMRHLGSTTVQGRVDKDRKCGLLSEGPLRACF
ncbi:hypothetical protein XA68_11000 [Ophiocordyceps unilateralis]|uniref:Uncharacterized protein n=1 Tax=Ophiocordyceps unilateralis TaxID=268505 RepID=A0A2A9PQM6_OPHUN|nr:hypothetical protein XA68_11000 [Ophiocordyceps unilateralis]